MSGSVTNPPPDGGAAEDLRLVRRCLDGDARATAELTQRLECLPRMIAALDRRAGPSLPDADLADLAQDVFILVWDRRDRYEGRARLETWVYRFCLLELMNRRRKIFRRQTLPLGDADPGAPAPPDGPVAEAARLESLLAELGPPAADVVRLRHSGGLTFQQIATHTELPGGTIKGHYYKGLKWLRSRLAEEGGEQS
ncbi:MAG: RNA polymerase sigma factor [Phycisphaerales bacterium]